MINSILNYILKREAYRKYTDLRNLNSKDKSKLFVNFGTFAILFMWAILCISTVINFNFFWGISLFFIPISFIRVISSFMSGRKKTRPIYSDVPIRKSDRRYKTGYRVEGYRQEITSYEALSKNEIEIRKNHFKGRMYFWFLMLFISSIVFVYCYNKTPLNSISKKDASSPWNVLKTGDSVYVTKDEIKNTISGIILYQLARPINKSDIDTLKISDWKKKQMIDKLDTTITNELIEAFEYNSEYFYKRNSSLIGIYVGKDSVLNVSEEYENEWIEVTPVNKDDKNKSIFNHDKDGYVFENRYYIKASQTSIIDCMKNNKKK